MEQSQEDIAANETAESAEFRRNDRNIPTDPIEMSLGGPTPSSTGPYSVNDAGLRVEEVNVRNYRYQNASGVGCSRSTNEEISQEGRYSYKLACEGPQSRSGDGDLISENKDSARLSSRGDLRRTRLSFQDAKHLSSNQNNANSNRISTQLPEGPKNIISSNRTQYSSSFSKFFLGKYPKPAKKDVLCENPRASFESCTATMAQNTNSDSLMNTNSVVSQLNSHDIVTEGSELPHCGTNLREWLESKGFRASKTDRLRLFRQIVQTVDFAHCRGIGLLDLRPSSFILSETADVKYIGPLMECELLSENQDNTKKRGLEQENSARDNFRIKMQKLGEDKSGRLNRKTSNQFIPEIIDTKNSYDSKWQAQKCWPTSDGVQLERKWYAFPEGEILQSELLYGSESTSLNNDEDSCADMIDDAESDLLLHFLVLLMQHKQNKAFNLLEDMEFLDLDIKVIERSHASRRSSDTTRSQIPCSSISRTNLLRDKLLGNIGELENAYFSLRSHAQLTEMPEIDRSDKEVLKKRERWQTQNNLQTMEEKSVDRVGTFFDGICKFARYNNFEVCGTLRNGDILDSNNVICSLSFDREEEYIAAAGVSKKIKIFELGSLLNDNIDVQYPVLEMSNKSKFSCICWNNYIRNYLVSSDYDGIVQIWDAGTGQGFAQYKEHQKRAWSVDFSRVDPTKFASGGDDCSIRLWNTNEKSSVGTIWNPANICCVQFSAYSSHLLAFGSADYKIYCYDLRHTKIPWCTLAGHGNAVSYVRFLDSDTIVSASTDNTLKLWDLKKTSLEGLSPNACSLTFSGHTNEKNFVGLGVLDGYIACGSETNEVYAYYRSLPMPITSHKFGSIDPISGHETTDGNRHFVSSVCWRRKSQMIAAANSSGSIKILRMV
ncbi:hypothetical protein DH2020_023075 [Rehmannia glutinosa]|uniref:Uncharacterized protein n=1 Tax=Rehmannia glutinosa TaxID=99300 RepID=A0ABR0W506_REHGL